MDRLEVFLGELLDINPDIDIGEIERAYNKAEQMHEGQNRKSGEPYLVHPVAVAKILAELGMDDRTIIAGLLHDSVEDTPYSIEDAKEDFGSDVALLIDGVTKLGSLVYTTKEERQAENLRKMFLAMSKDIRVLIIKLADRLHNLRTINYMNKDQILEKCRETLEIYTPLAGRLGIYAMKFELEDIALKYIDPDMYYDIVAEIESHEDEEHTNIDAVIRELKVVLDEIDVNYDIYGRSKHLYSIYKKMKYQNKQIEEIFDLTAVRILVDSVKDCYAVLGMVHTLWRPLPGRFKDYIAVPKPNLYRSLHTTVISDNNPHPFEIQIRTHEMHRVAEYGIAAHWKYKEGVDTTPEETNLSWLRQTLEWNKDVKDPRDFMEMLKMDLFSNQVFVFTPKGEVIELPAGSTPIDFAFKIHTDVGAKCVGAKVNGKMVPIDYVLCNGEIVNILTQNNSKGPSIDWLQIAKSNSARTKIRQWLKKQDRAQTVDKGKELLEKAVKRKGHDVKDYIRNSWVSKVAKELSFTSVEDLYSQISNGGVVLSKSVALLEKYYDDEKKLTAKPTDEELVEKTNKKIVPKETGAQDDIIVEGVSNILIRYARCCSPVPGDDIIGFITKGRGLSIHCADCTNILNLSENDHGRLMKVEWNVSIRKGTYDAVIVIEAQDRKGLFSDISRKCVDLDVNISQADLKTNNEGDATFLLTLSIKNISHMDKILSTLRQIESVTNVYRSKA